MSVASIDRLKRLFGLMTEPLEAQRVPEVGLEPTPSCEDRILNPLATLRSTILPTRKHAKREGGAADIRSRRASCHCGAYQMSVI